ncbi:30S ribosomal protein S9 [Candidatus Gracilibacteria bacterium]|nr:30S ribosomal protein S9 [Candidatus Gracilibacteria bacterium]MCF7898411.1 30S ribosomal protein S9 [Candidatus Paceibacterota bacterium]
MATETKQRYIEAVGRRKTAIARVRITPAAKTSFVVNDKELKDYFVTEELQTIVQEAITKSEVGDKFFVSVHVLGGGIHAQAEAVRHGLSRTLVLRDEDIKNTLKKLGFLKRDSRQVERKKFGLKKARKAPTWSKR